MSPVGVVDSAGQSQTGHVRRHNEDSYLMRGPLFLVADGMGGAAAGEIASTMCTEAFAEINLIRLQGADALRSAVRSANARIYERATADAELAGMGTTAIAALVDEKSGNVAFAHVGDSRAYLFRGGVLRRLSEDHSVVAELVASGHLTEEEAVSHPQRSVITRALGAEPNVEVDTFVIEGMAGDTVLLCSDGLTGMVGDERIAELLAADAPAEAIVRSLIRAALEGGGEDNITALVFRLGEVDEQPTGSIRMILTTDPDLEPADDDSEPWRPGRRTLLVSLGVLCAIAVLAVGAAIGLRKSHFIGANETTGRVEIYQGVPWDLFGGLKLYHPVRATSITYASLDPQTRKELFDHRLRSYDDAEAEIKRIEVGTP